MELVIWTYIFGGATIFGVIVGVFSVYNGRMTRRELSQVIDRGNERSHSLLARMAETSEQNFKRADDRLERTNGRVEKLTELTEQISLHMQDMDRRHAELMTRIAEKTH